MKRSLLRWRGAAMAAVVLVCTLLGSVQADDTVLVSNRMKLPTLGNTMNFGSCMDYSWVGPLPVFGPSPWCCVPLICPSFGSCYCPWFAKGKRFEIQYWEPSAIIEVSCRNAYSVLNPGKVNGRGEAALQSCVGPSSGSKRWFFEARVWAIDGYTGRARHQSSGGYANAEKVRQCSMAGDDTTKGQYWGYGVKYDKFTKGPANGPGQSWEAYISDRDPNWAKDSGNVQKPPPQQACKHGDVDVEKCWGSMGGAGGENGGWVSAPNQTVAAALVAWRAHAKALQMKKVSPAGQGGFKMNMDYPFIHSTSPYASSAGLQGGDQMKGSQCFKPGDAGPEWYSHNEENMTVDKIVEQIQNMKPGDASLAAEVQPGIYIFTVWVHTKCTRYTISGGKPVGVCFYKNGS